MLNSQDDLTERDVQRICNPTYERDWRAIAAPLGGVNTRIAGEFTCEETPDPFPNSVVKLARPMVVLIGRE